ncbi:hypothetical protein SAMN05660912_02050 [Pseudomonas sp. LAMO17WK12:I1]|nr:hypothetical protein SAMN05660912_02050 [Pseudomonas sp. LAMO17WK12:I1]
MRTGELWACNPRVAVLDARMAKAYGLFVETGKPAVFYLETKGLLNPGKL